MQCDCGYYESWWIENEIKGGPKEQMVNEEYRKPGKTTGNSNTFFGGVGVKQDKVLGKIKVFTKSSKTKPHNTSLIFTLA